MYFNREDLQQLTPEYIGGLPPQRRDALIEKLREDLIEAQDRLNQNPSNSSRPPSSRAPWDRSVEKNTESPAEECPEEPPKECTEDDNSTDKQNGSSDEGNTAGSAECPKRKPGKQKGAKGFGRIQKLSVTQTVFHKPKCCKGCEREFDEGHQFHAKGGHYTIDLKVPEPSTVGLHVENTKHVYGSIRCECGFETSTNPHRVDSDAEWVVEMGEWRLIGPVLLAFLVFLKTRMHLTVSKSRELLAIWLGISLSDGSINTAIREAGRAASSLEPQLLEALRASELLNVDETAWKEHKVTRWFWAAIGDGVAYYTVGPRSCETADKILAGFTGWLMTDGYGVYRHFEKRLRCWAHLERKAKALEESWDKDAASFGAYAVKTFRTLRERIYRMREIKPAERSQEQSAWSQEQEACDEDRLQLIMKCLDNNTAQHEATRAFAVEILNDHKVIFQVIATPDLSLTNNRAERFLRNWVIARNMCHGSKTQEGSQAVAILASVVDTLRMRGGALWQFVAQTIGLRRSGQAAPTLPPPLPAPS